MYFFRVGYIIVLLFASGSILQAQGVRRQVIGFYGNTGNLIKSTGGQLVSGSFLDNSFFVVQGFQQPLQNKLDISLNVLVDTTICENDSLLLKTGHGHSYQWFRNDTLIQHTSSNSLIVKREGIYKLVGYDGISRFDTGKSIRVSFMKRPVKPIISGLRKDTLYCFTDTLLLSSSSLFDKYLWSTGDTTRSIKAQQSGAVSLQVGNRIGLTSKYCYSAISDTILVQRNITPIPMISRTGDNLISSLSNQYKWFYNYRMEPFDSVRQTTIKNKGSYYVTTSLDGKCWSFSDIYLVQTDPISSLQADYRIAAYPNPFISQFYLQFGLDKRYSGRIQLSISDANGIIKWSGSRFIYNERSFKIPINVTLPKGVYVVQVVMNGYRRKSIQVIRM